MNYRKLLVIVGLCLLSSLSIVLTSITENVSAKEIYAAGRSYPATITKIIDGDTVDVAINGREERVRLACINTPERGEKPFYKQAKDYLAGLVPVGSNIQVLVSPQVRDNTKSKRLVAEIFIQGAREPVNQTMVAQGQAVVYCKFIGNCNRQSYLVSERSAKKAKLGIWNPRLIWNQANRFTCK